MNRRRLLMLIYSADDLYHKWLSKVGGFDLSGTKSFYNSVQSKYKEWVETYGNIDFDLFELICTAMFNADSLATIETTYNRFNIDVDEYISRSGIDIREDPTKLRDFACGYLYGCMSMASFDGYLSGYDFKLLPENYKRTFLNAMNLTDCIGSVGLFYYSGLEDNTDQEIYDFGKHFYELVESGEFTDTTQDKFRYCISYGDSTDKAASCTFERIKLLAETIGSDENPFPFVPQYNLLTLYHMIDVFWMQDDKSDEKYKEVLELLINGGL